MSDHITPRVASESSTGTAQTSVIGQRVAPYVGSIITNPPFTVITSYSERYMKGYNTPHFQKRIRRGELVASTPWEQYTSSGLQTSSEYDLTYGDHQGPYRQHEWTNGPVSVDNAWMFSPDWVKQQMPSLDMYLVQDAAASIYNQGWDALTFAAEATQLKGLLTGAYKALKSIREIKFMSKMTWAQIRFWFLGRQHLESEYLAYRYGWRPFVGDILSINAVLRGLCEGVTKRHKRKARTSDSSTITSMVNGGGGLVCTYDCYHNTSWTMDSTAAVVADMLVPPVQFNPLQTGWELIPFSFVIDWFLTVGSVISALSVRYGSSSYVASIGQRISMRRESSYQSVPGPWYYSGQCRLEYKSEAEYTVRVPCSIPIIPRPRVRMTWTKILDLVSMIIQRIR